MRLEARRLLELQSSGQKAEESYCQDYEIPRVVFFHVQETPSCDPELQAEERVTRLAGLRVG